ncbi:MAG: N-acetylmuramoyl-L-alanine amidase [Candidatus Tectomicrobia bacterium]|uniref:N-acetylmuramoyl-L-alanine amidase n=1 Tax=Tectimicrobiota bacterium TaxID=2528274 RepID=A0A932M241_UNCTE|nr:N-acetylmuramoyl-L-alanine amidase [Candidatus Tectomicrobia bacterium]
MKHPGKIVPFLIVLGLLLAGLQIDEAAAAPRPNPPSGTSEPIRITGIRHQPTSSSSRVVIDLEAQVPFEGHRLSDPPRLYVDLFGVNLSRPLSWKTVSIGDGIIDQARLAENRPGVVRVVLDLAGPGEHRIFSLPDPPRLIIEVKRKDGKAPSDQVGEARTAARRLKIVIDPGHGGKDPGAIGPGRLEEKEVVLDISLRVKRLLDATGRYETLLTRSGDVFIPLEERTAIANSHKADLFVSIHANANTKKTARGISTYRLGMNPDQDAVELAARENKTSRRKLSEVELILKDLVLTSKSNESILLAQTVQSAMVNETRSLNHNGSDLGIREALFYVLVGAEMPAVLTEVSFITNLEEEKLLRKDAYRQALAQGIVQGIEMFLQESKRVTSRAN